MKLYEEGKIDLKKKIGSYLPLVSGTNKQDIIVEQLLLHEGGLIEYIPFYKETLDNSGRPLKNYYQHYNKDCFSTLVANDLLLRSDITDTFYNRIINSPLSKSGKYVYSDVDFIFLGKIIEHISGMPLDEYVRKNFYLPMCIEAIDYLPLKRVSYDRIVPSTKESGFRNQILRGYVHDQGAAIMGGVAGHAGLFSDAHGVASVMQMLLNGGAWNGKKYLNKETIKLFTSYQSKTSRRGFGFDKPEKDNAVRNEPYPSRYASETTFGHTGFTGTCTWADPKENLIFIFLSNRIYPEDNKIFRGLNIRLKIFDTIYNSIGKGL
jgi:CubicO group peptidase (beta-lactamase class C family)